MATESMNEYGQFNVNGFGQTIAIDDTVILLHDDRDMTGLQIGQIGKIVAPDENEGGDRLIVVFDVFDGGALYNVVRNPFYASELFRITDQIAPESDRIDEHDA